MKILHTSDWHIGKRLMGRERLDEQAEVLDEIAAVCERENIELVLLAGDVFDTYTPSAEAEDLFFTKIKRIAGGERAVLIISGNHDDGVRLSAVAPLSEEQGIYIVGNARNALKVTKDGYRKTHPIASGKGYVVFENERGEKAFISTLPYPNEARFKEEKSELPYVEQMKKWIDEGESGNVEGLPSVFMAHLFVAGGSVSEGEREIDLGGARAIPVDALPHSNYIALGHLHKKQHMGKGDCYYSGSPLQYSFDESADKGVKVFDLTSEGVRDLKDVPLTKGKRLVRLEAVTVEDALTLLDRYENELVELRIVLSAPLTTSDAQALAAKRNLVSLIPEIRTEESVHFHSRKGLSDEALFTAYYRTAYDSEPKQELKELFLKTLAEIQEK
ncbi:MAG: exonuclease subunit SbcD [Clostridia bacterium]|nr:exonuclease subunit SbcD [Clostridia bacterium]